MDAKELIGKEIVDAVNTEEGMALLFDDGLIFYVDKYDGAACRSKDWDVEWKRIVADNS